jgi:hypothetical protein
MRISVLVICLAACGGTAAKPELAGIGLLCDSAHPCPDGLECGTCGIATGQCVAPCTASGFDGCPAGSFCSRAWDGTNVHVCVRMCTHDIDCKTPTGNDGLSCNDPYLDPGTDVNDVSICNVSNSIGSQNRCP